MLHTLFSYLPELLAFAEGIGWAWWTGWNTTTLVWSLWLSSLAVGGLSILIGIDATTRTTIQTLRGQRRDSPALARFAVPLALLYGVFLLAFFCVHFGFFHWGHSVFLNLFFPISGGDPLGRSPIPTRDEYLKVLREAWGFIPMALVAERHRLFAPASAGETHAGPAGEGEAVRAARAQEGPPAAREVAQATAQDTRLIAPYRNVVRLHLLLFFFSFAILAGVPGMWIYLVVYTVYFFPWKKLRKQGPRAAPAPAAR